jgi:hypothetical protein
VAYENFKPLHRCSWLMLLILTLSGYLSSEEHNKYVCSEPNPESSARQKIPADRPPLPSTVGVKRTSNSAAVTPDTPGAKSNTPFCVKTGTTMTWKSTGIVVDFGPSAPFEPAGQQSSGLRPICFGRSQETRLLQVLGWSLRFRCNLRNVRFGRYRTGCNRRR